MSNILDKLTVDYIEHLIEQINNIDDHNLLEEYMDEITHIINDSKEEIPKINDLLAALNKKLAELSSDLAMSVEKSNLITINEFLEILEKRIKGEDITEDEIAHRESFLQDMLGKMATGDLPQEEQHLLDSYIINIKDIPDLTKIEEKNIQDYEAIRNKSLIKTNPQELKKKPKPIADTSGIIMTVVILEGTILLGILIAVIALVNR